MLLIHLLRRSQLQTSRNLWQSLKTSQLFLEHHLQLLQCIFRIFSKKNTQICLAITLEKNKLGLRMSTMLRTSRQWKTCETSAWLNLIASWMRESSSKIRETALYQMCMQLSGRSLLTWTNKLKTGNIFTVPLFIFQTKRLYQMSITSTLSSVQLLMSHKSRAYCRYLQMLCSVRAQRASRASWRRKASAKQVMTAWTWLTTEA